MTAMPSEAVTHSSSALSNSNIGNVENQSSCASAQSDTASRVVEEDHNFTNIPLEALQQAGINVEGGTAIQEEQMNPLMMLTNRTSSVNAATHVHDKSELVGSSSESSTENLDSLTMLISGDGSLKLTDTSNREILFTAEQLAAENIDVNNLTDESIQHVIQMAYHINKEPVQKRRKLESNTNINDVHRISYDDALISTSSAMDHASIASTSSQQVTVPNDHRFDLIGEVVDVKKGNKIFPATIRYCKPGYFKVQHSDGHFEWVTHDQIQMRGWLH
ncbi:hypothetical protein AB6A40_011080 [Gnathostoma spinigerum]|uniref:Uncharacterized protein n=1 Tax=Gnathostoma spinigerum TaxID=75299 RepID=A0ABD6F2C4_9BILA